MYVCTCEKCLFFLFLFLPSCCRLTVKLGIIFPDNETADDFQSSNPAQEEEDLSRFAARRGRRRLMDPANLAKGLGLWALSSAVAYGIGGE